MLLLHTTLNVLTDAVLSLLPQAHVAAIHLLDHGDLLCVARSHRASIPISCSGQTFRFGEGLVGWTAKHGEAVLLSKPIADQRFVPRCSQSYIINSLVLVPISYSSEVLGVVGATSSIEEAFHPNDAEHLGQLIECMIPRLCKFRIDRLLSSYRFDQVDFIHADSVALIERASGIVHKRMQELFSADP